MILQDRLLHHAGNRRCQGGFAKNALLHGMGNQFEKLNFSGVNENSQGNR
jgi:hypothetical protein